MRVSLLLSLVVALAVSCCGVYADPILTLTTPQGTITGAMDNGSTDVRAWKGIPFAQPPVGALRWAAPHPYSNFVGTFQATAFGSVCAQPIATAPYLLGAEDCLTLNVYAPANPTSASLPVYIYIYGGGFIAGSAAQTPGADFVRGGNGVVVVTINYRLGPWGFFAHPALSNERGVGNVASSGNYGIEDQRAAMKWVQANIAAYGGDPTRVTIGGESAGAISVCVHIVSSLSAGLFTRALSESGGCDTPIHTLVQAETLGTQFAAGFGVFAGNADCAGASGDAATLVCLRSLPAVLIVQATAVLGGFGFFGSYALSPNIDGYNVKDYPINLLMQGKFNPVSLVVGTNTGEMGAFLAPFASPSQFPAASPAAIAQYANTLSGGNAAIQSYYVNATASGSKASTLIAFQSLLSKRQFQCPSLRLARYVALGGNDVRMYVFDYASPPLAGLSALMGGALHSTELPFVFGTPTQVTGSSANPSTTANWTYAADAAMSHSIQTYGVKFIQTGDVNAAITLSGIPSANAPAWTPFTQAGADALTFHADGSISMVQNVYKTECDLWDVVSPALPAFVARIVVAPVLTSTGNNNGGGVGSSTGGNSAFTSGPSALLSLVLGACMLLVKQW